MSQAAVARLLSLVFHAALLTWLHTAFDALPKQWASKRGRAAIELQASIAAAPPSTAEEMKILRAEAEKTPSPPRQEIAKVLDAAKTELQRRPPDTELDRPLPPADSQWARVENVAVTREPPPEPPPQTEPPKNAVKRPPLPAAPFEAVASVASSADDGSQFDEAPRPDRFNRNPPYPPEPYYNRIEGEVLLRIHVTIQGTVGRVWVVQSSGVPSFDEAAVKAAQGWRFEPGRRRGVYVAGDVEKVVRFRFSRPGEFNRSML
jgi:protein TonB